MMFNNVLSPVYPYDEVDKRFLEMEIQRWKYSPERMEQIDGDRYYNGHHDILHRKRQAIGKDGELHDVNNLVNNRIVDNQFAKMVDQKTSYLLSKPVTFETDNEATDAELSEVFGPKFMNTLKNGGSDALCGGLFWLYVYYDEQGKLSFQRFKPFEVLPYWRDYDHTELDCAVRLYEIQGYEGDTPKIYEKVEVFTKNGIYRYDLVNNALIEDVDKPHGYYAYVGEQGFTWEQIPLVCFKANSREIPLIRRVKRLQDALNLTWSDFANTMQEDSRNKLMVLKNYDGQNLGEFRQLLSLYGAVKVRSGDGENGGVEVLDTSNDPTSFETTIKALKKAIIENAMGYDAKDDRMGANANIINIKSMYSDVDLAADDMENEFRLSFDKLMFFVKAYLNKEFDVRITFNRDMLTNETEIIDNLVKLGVKLPNELLVGQVPFVNDVQEVMDMLDKEQEDMDIYAGAFPNNDAAKEAVNNDDKE